MEKDKVFFKIIMPNYNSMAYIKRCIDSILSQTFQDFKIIIVDDLSTDLSDKFIQSYARKFPDKIIFKRLDEKGYAGAARNAGMKYPLKSEYVWFIDSDDYLASKDVLQMMHKKILQCNMPDILRCSYIDSSHYGNSVVVLNADAKSILKDGAAPFKTCIRSCFNMTFVENRARNNDVIWFMKLMDAIDYKKIASIQQPCCVYNRKSLTSCQNNIKMAIDKKCVDADRLLVEDLNQLKLTNKYVIDRKNRVAAKYSKMYKNIISLDNVIKYSLVISIDKNRYISMCKLFRSYGFDKVPSILYGSTFKNRTGQYNCKHSHMRAVQYAKEHNWPYVMIFEDDAYPCDDITRKMEDYLYAIPYDASLVLFGWSHSYRQSFNKPFNKISETAISGSHAYMVFAPAYDKFISYHKNNPQKSADNTVFKKISPSYVIDYPLFIQYTSNKSMNGHIGFAYYGNSLNPPKNFSMHII